MTRTLTLSESVRRRFEEKYMPEPMSGCWLWLGALSKYGYGTISGGRAHNHVPLFAHRVSWEIANGPIPPGLSICHKCDNTACVNPQHLYAGTQRQNIQDALDRGRWTQHGASVGADHHLAKLTEDDVKEIRRAAEAGETRVSLARRFGVDPTNISCITLRKTWTHI